MKKTMKVIGMVALFFSLSLYLESQELKDSKVPTKLKIFTGKTLEYRFILLDTKNNKKIGTTFKEVTEFKSVVGKMISKVKMENNKYGFIDSNGTWIFKPIFDDARTFSKENLARVKINDKWGFIKSNGTWLIKPIFPYVGAFKNNYAFVKDDNGLFHYINVLGKRAFKGNFNSASNFCENDQAVVSLRESYGRIDTTGKVVEPFIHLKKSEAMKGCINSHEAIMGVTMYGIAIKNKYWGIEDDGVIVKKFPSNIISPLDCSEAYIPMFMDEKTMMVDEKGGLVYLDSNGEINYYFSSNPKGTMSLYNAKNKEIWKSNIEKFKFDSCQFKEETEEERQFTITKSSKLKWKIPSKKNCILNGGKIKNGVCSATWSDAMKICKENTGRLPTIKELEGFIMGCGGELKDDNKAEQKRNTENSEYQACYKNKEFISDLYWSSSFDADFAHYIWLVDFSDGSIGANTKKYKYNIQCVK